MLEVRALPRSRYWDERACVDLFGPGGTVEVAVVTLAERVERARKGSGPRAGAGPGAAVGDRRADRLLTRPPSRGIVGDIAGPLLAVEEPEVPLVQWIGVPAPRIRLRRAQEGQLEADPPQLLALLGCVGGAVSGRWVSEKSATGVVRAAAQKMSQPIGSSATWMRPHTVGGIDQGGLPRSARNRAARAQPQAKKTTATAMATAKGSRGTTLATPPFIGNRARPAGPGGQRAGQSSQRDRA